MDDNNFIDRISYVYIVGIALWILYFRAMGGFKLLANDKSYIIAIIFWLGIVFMLLNFYFTRREIIESYDKEVSIYSYVEKNAAVALGVTLAIAFLLNSFVDGEKQVQAASIAFAVVGFIILMLGVIVIVWMPTNDKRYINALKHIKTVPLTIGILSIAIAAGIIASYRLGNKIVY